ncbi:MAG: monofunctional biosynthetic peptidoglycan transglycosylase [Verrucomicrobia bacterium]|nr:monofunctional biosynthetic peptidoglycan transglycosylase [Verrucomicrobiota bacterium]
MKPPGVYIRRLSKGAGVVLGCFLVFTVLWVVLYKWVNPPFSNLMILRRLEPGNQSPLYNLRKTWVPLDRISPHFVHSVLLGEDCDFYIHNGVNFDLILHALKKDLQNDTVASSTITQQTAKNLFLYPRKSYLRKALEVYFSFLMEWIWGKQRILEVYLNIFELGSNIYGVGKGAEVYFSKSAGELCFDESCLLAAILPFPRNVDIRHPNNYVIYRASYFYNKGLQMARLQQHPPLFQGRQPCFPIL